MVPQQLEGARAGQPVRWWRRPGWKRGLSVARFAVGLGLAAVALLAVLGQRGELTDANEYLSSLRWGWLVMAVVAEAASVVAFAGLQGRLLRSGGLGLGLRPLTAITLAGNSINNSLPGGPAFASVFAFRQFRRRGADETLATWVIVATTVLAALALAGLAAVGLVVAGSQGSAFDLAGVILATLALAIGVNVVLRRQGVVRALVDAAVRVSQRVSGRPRGNRAEVVDRAFSRITAVSPSPGQLGRALSWAMGNWAFDCACLVLAFLAVGAAVPWRGLLLAYGAGQLAANLPVTPGGLGVVEGSLTIAIVAYGGARASTVAAVLLYRIVSFWASLPIGWLVYAVLTVKGRSQDRQAQAEVPEPEGVAA